jgi:hypothetical protein
MASLEEAVLSLRRDEDSRGAILGLKSGRMPLLP